MVRPGQPRSTRLPPRRARELEVRTRVGCKRVDPNGPHADCRNNLLHQIHRGEPMKGHVGAFLFGLSVAAAGAFIYDKKKRGEISVDQISEDIQDISGAVRDKVSDLAAVAATTIVDINQ